MDAELADCGFCRQDLHNKCIDTQQPKDVERVCGCQH